MKIEKENTDYKEDRAVLWSGAFNLDSDYCQALSLVLVSPIQKYNLRDFFIQISNLKKRSRSNPIIQYLYTIHPPPPQKLSKAFAYNGYREVI